MPYVVAVLHWCDGVLAIETPDCVQDGFQADPMLVDGPQLNLGMRKRGRYVLKQRAQGALSSAWATASACTWRGRGFN